MFLGCSPCCSRCDGCFIDVTGTYSYQYTSPDCTGTLTGTIVDGTDPNGFLFIFCTEGSKPCDYVEYGTGLIINIFATGNGSNCIAYGWVDGEVETHLCSESRSLVGTYTLTHCSTNNTGTLVIS